MKEEVSAASKTGGTRVETAKNPEEIGTVIQREVKKAKHPQGWLHCIRADHAHQHCVCPCSPQVQTACSPRPVWSWVPKLIWEIHISHSALLGWRSSMLFLSLNYELASFTLRPKSNLFVFLPFLSYFCVVISTWGCRSDFEQSHSNDRQMSPSSLHTSKPRAWYKAGHASGERHKLYWEKAVLRLLS